jgi:hypothetical protein
MKMKKAICAILLVLYFIFMTFRSMGIKGLKDICFFSPYKGTEVVQFIDTSSSRVKVSEWGNKSKIVNFVISNPPKNELALLDLISKHFQSFASNDTLEKYIYYYHEYYEETCSTRRDYIEKRENYSFIYDYLENDSRDDLLAKIIVKPEHNKQEVTLYKKRNRVREITKEWRETKGGIFTVWPRR